MRTAAVSAAAAAAVVVAVACLGVAVGAGCPADPPRLLERVSISGRVVLVGQPPLDDLSRVRVDVGRGEGGVAVESDGTFSFRDLEPDDYRLTITFSGGLTDQASRSAYLPYDRRIVGTPGAAVDVGDVELTLASGTVRGTVVTSDGSAPAGARVSLLAAGDGALRTVAVDAGGAFAFAAVPVGRHALTVGGAGFAGAAFAGDACAGDVVVDAADDDVVVPPLSLSSTAVTLDPGEGQVQRDDGARWVMARGQASLDVVVDAAFARAGRLWLNDAPIPGYVALGAGGGNNALPAGALPADATTLVHVQLRDLCAYESPVFTIEVVRDETAPVVVDVAVGGANDAGFVRALAAPLFVGASDALARALSMRHVVCDSAAGADAAACSGALAAEPYRPLASETALAFAGDGARVARVQVADDAGNESAVAEVAFVVDTAAPSVTGILIGDGSGVIFERTATVTLLGASDATAMRVGLTAAALGGAPFEPFRAQLALTFPAGDGAKDVFVQLADAAGNVGDVVGGSATLVTVGRVVGCALLEEGGAAAGASVAVLGALSATTGADGCFDVGPVASGTVTVVVGAPGRVDARVSGVFVPAGGVADVGDVVLAVARGALSGTVTLEGASDHGGVLVELVGTGIATVSASDGAWRFDDVAAGSYTLRASKLGFVSVEEAGVTVAPATTNAAPALQLDILGGRVVGCVLLEEGGAAAGASVALLGALSATTGADGCFDVGPVASGTVTVVVGAPGRVDARVTGVFVPAGGVADVGDVVLAVARGALSGTVTLEGASDHGGVLVELVGTGIATVSASDGAWRFDDVAAGSYTLRASKLGFVSVEEAGVTVAPATTNVAPGLQLAILGGRVVGVVDLDGLADDGGVLVSLGGGGVAFSATTDAAGAFVIDDVPLGVYTLRADRAGFFPEIVGGVAVQPAQTTDLGRLVLLGVRGTVRGLVRLEGRSDHAGATVTLFGGDGPFTTTSAADGSYELRVPLATYESVVATAGAQFAEAGFSDIIAVNENGITNIPTLALAATANDVSGRATLFGQASGHDAIVIALAGIPGEVTQGLSVPAPTTRAPDGSYTFASVPLGPWRATFSLPSEPDRETATRDIEVAAGAPTVVRDVVLREQFVVINDDALVTTSPLVELRLGSSDCVSMAVRTDDAFAAGDFFSPCVTTMSAFDIGGGGGGGGGGDGVKSVFARFRDTLGNESASVVDDIELDSGATIASVSEDSFGAALDRSDPLHIALDAGEPGAASVDIVGHEAGITLFDDGTNGDAAAGDGVFERDYVVAQAGDVVDAAVVGHFVDDHGNVAADVAAPGGVTILIPPRLFAIVVESDTEAGTARIAWETDEPTTGEVLFGTDNTYGTSLATPLGGVHQVTITGLVASVEYHFRIRATDQAPGAGNLTQTSDRTFFLRPSAPANVVAMPGDGRFDVRWEAPPQENVVGYHVYRALTAGGSRTRLTGPAPYTHEALLFSDELADGTSNVTNGTAYFYVVTALDSFGNESEPSMEVNGTPTANTGPTYVGGALVGDQVWTSSASPFVVSANLAVQDGNRLVIAPGTTVEIADNLFIRVDGELIVVGSADDARVIFRSSVAGASGSRWRSLFFSSSSTPARVSVVEHAYLGGSVLSGVEIFHGGLEAVLGSDSFFAGPDFSTAFQSGIGAAVDVVGASPMLSSVRFFAGGTAIGAVSAVVRGRDLAVSGIRGVAVFIVHSEVELQRFTADGNVGKLVETPVSDGFVRNKLVIRDAQLTQNTGAPLFRFQQNLEATFDDVVIADNFSAGPMMTSARGRDLDFVVVSSTLRDNSSAGLFMLQDFCRVELLQSALIDNDSQGATCHGLCSPSATEVGRVNAVGVTVVSSSPQPAFGGALTGQVRASQFRGSASAAAPLVFGLDFAGNSFLGTGLVHFASASPFAAGAAHDARSNYWGVTATAEMLGEGADSDIEAIHDFFDDIALGKVDYSAFATDPFPLVRITSPRFGQRFRSGASINLTGFADDPAPQPDGSFVDLPVPAASLTWSSDLDGFLGAGASLTTSTLRTGRHTITLSAVDDDGQTGEVFVEIEVLAP